MRTLSLFVVLALGIASIAGAGQKVDAASAFDREEIKPYIRIMDGPWVGNAVTGGPGHYRITVTMPPAAKYVLGLFDEKINRSGADERSAVVLVDGVNPLNPSQTVDIAHLDKADVAAMSKAPLDGVTFNAKTTTGKDCSVKVVDAKEEGAVGPFQPFAIPAGRKGKNLGRLDVFIFAGPAYPSVPGQTVQYGQPLTRYTIIMQE